MTGDDKSDKKLSSKDITPESTYLNRRSFLQTSIFAGSLLATGGVYRYFRDQPGDPTASKDVMVDTDTGKVRTGPDGEAVSSFGAISGYNNYYEFSTDKGAVANEAKDWNPGPWQVEVTGLVGKPRTFTLEDLLKFEQEERIYRFRCVEGWSMVIPWMGFPLARLLKEVEPLGRATHVAFTTYYDKVKMPNSRWAGIPLPYVEGLRLDEAMHGLTLMATGLYGKTTLPNQNGAPIRLVVPWKYGFKSIKSVVKIEITDREPPTTWNIVNPEEYGFYSNVNPAVDHPRWSQAQERRIGENGLRPTLPFNGYASEVASLYTGLDLRKNF